MTTIEKISKLRQKMQEKGINAFIVFSADPHMSEYLPEEWQERTWLSGFTGSAGFLVVGVFLLSLVFEPLYVVSVVVLLILLGVYFSGIKFSFSTIFTLVVSIVLLAGISFGAPKVCGCLNRRATFE